TRSKRDWSSDVCSSDLEQHPVGEVEVRHNRSIIGMLLLAALASITIGAVLQTAMPVFGGILTPTGGDSDFTYGVLLFAMGAGGAIGRASCRGGGARGGG